MVIRSIPARFPPGPPHQGKPNRCPFRNHNKGREAMDIFQETALGFHIFHESELSKAVSLVDADRVAALLDSGADVEELDWHGATPLITAAHSSPAFLRSFREIESLSGPEIDSAEEGQARLRELFKSNEENPPEENLAILNLLLERGA